MKYYLLHLNNNSCSNKSKIDNVKLVQELPSDSYSYYQSIPVLAYESFELFKTCMIDVLTGKKIYLDEGNLMPAITYTCKIEISEKEKINISELYKSMSKEDIERYKKGMCEIETNAKIKYYESIQKEETYNNRLINANKYLEDLCANN